MIWAHPNYPSIIPIHLLSLTEQSIAILFLFLLLTPTTLHMNTPHLLSHLHRRHLRHRFALHLIRALSVPNLQLTVRQLFECIDHSLLYDRRLVPRQPPLVKESRSRIRGVQGRIAPLVISRLCGWRMSIVWTVR